MPSYTTVSLQESNLDIPIETAETVDWYETMDYLVF